MPRAKQGNRAVPRPPRAGETISNPFGGRKALERRARGPHGTARRVGVFKSWGTMRSEAGARLQFFPIAPTCRVLGGMSNVVRVLYHL